MNLYDEFVADVGSRGPALRAAALFFAGALLLMSVGVGLFYFGAGRGAPPSGATDAERIPGQTYTVGFIEVFQCLREGPGPKGCDEFEGAQDFLIASMDPKGIEYQPLKSSDPGDATDDGTKVFIPTKTTPAPQWRAFANAATLRGAVATSVVDEDHVKVSDSGVTAFPISTPQGDFLGQMTLGSTEDGNLVISKVLYMPATAEGDSG